MSHPPEKLKNFNFDNRHRDWKQLGIMAAYVASHPHIVTHEDYHNPKFTFPIKTLIVEGNTSQQSLLVCMHSGWPRVKNLGNS